MGMMSSKGKWCIKLVVMGLLFLASVGLVVMLLWNWLVPELFYGPQITYLQSLGLLLLCKILFSGFGGHKKKYGQYKYQHWESKMKSKLASLSEEERQKLKEKMSQKLDDNEKCNF